MEKSKNDITRNKDTKNVLENEKEEIFKNMDHENASIPINWIGLMETLIRTEYSQLPNIIISQVRKSEYPMVIFKLKSLLGKLDYEPLIERFRNSPGYFLVEFDTALKKLVLWKDGDLREIIQDLEIHIIPDDIDAEWLIPIKTQLSKDLTGILNKIVRFRGRFTSHVLNKLIKYNTVTWECLVCGTQFEILSATKMGPLRTPRFCTNRNCKADRKSDFIQIFEKSEAEEYRTFMIAETSQGFYGNEIKGYIFKNVDFFEEKLNYIHNSDEIEVIGILKTQILLAKKDYNVEYYIEVIDFCSINSVTINEEVVKDIKVKLTSQPDYLVEVIDSIHPYSKDILNFFPMKLIFAAAWITGNSSENIRQGINAIIGGHSGTIKSKVASAFENILGNANFGKIGGMGTTDKGLIPVGQRVQDEKDLVIRLGALALYNKKTLVIDEAQYLPLKALACFKCFDDGVIKRALDGTNIRAEAKGTLVLCLNYNTSDESYDFSKTIAQNTGFPDIKSLLDRFDLHYRIPRNTRKLVSILNKRALMPYKEHIPREIVYNYLVAAKEMYSKGITLSKKHAEIVQKLWDTIMIYKEEKYERDKSDSGLLDVTALLKGENEQESLSKVKRPVFNPRSIAVINKILRAIAAMHLRDHVIDEDFNFFKKHLINTIITFQDNPFLLQERIIDMNEVFCSSFTLFTELHEEHFDIAQFIEFLREYLESNFFEQYSEIDGEKSYLDDYVGVETNTKNHKFMSLIKKNSGHIKKKGYIKSIMNGMTSFINKEWALTETYKSMAQMFKDCNREKLEFNSVILSLEHQLPFSKKLLLKLVSELRRKEQIQINAKDDVCFVNEK